MLLSEANEYCVYKYNVLSSAYKDQTTICTVTIRESSVDAKLVTHEGNVLFESYDKVSADLLLDLHEAYLNFYTPRFQEPRIAFIDSFYILDHIKRMTADISVAQNKLHIRKLVKEMESGFNDLRVEQRYE